MKRRTRCSGITLTYSFRVATSELPAFSASQRRSVSSDQTLPTPAWVSTIEWTSAMTCSVSGAYSEAPLGNSIRTSIGLAPVSLASRRPLAATACCLSGT